MKAILIWLCSLVLVQADLPPYQGGATLAFEWTGLDQELAKVPDTKVSVPSPTKLHIEYTGKRPIVYTLRVIGPAFVSHFTSKHYAIDGHTRYENLLHGSFLELENWFAPDQPGGPEKFYYSRTLAEAGPMSMLEGTDDGRDFSLPFDATGATTPLVRLVLKLHLAGPGVIDLYGVRMSQYPDNPFLEGHNGVGITMLGSVVNYTLTGMENVPLERIATFLQNPALPRSDITYEITATKDVPYTAIKGLMDAFQKAGISNVRLNVLPETSLQPQHEIVIDVRAKDASGFEIISRGITYTPDTLKDGIRSDLAGDPQACFVIRAEKSVPHDDIASVLDALRDAHATNIFFANVDSAGSSSSPTQNTVSSFDRHSFALGIAAALGTILGACGLFLLARRFRHLRHARELRRIASLDG